MMIFASEVVMANRIPMTPAQLMDELKVQNPPAYASADVRIFIRKKSWQDREKEVICEFPVNGGADDSCFAHLWFEAKLGEYILEELEGLKEPTENDRAFKAQLLIWRDRVGAELELMRQNVGLHTVGELVARIALVTEEGAKAFGTYLKERSVSEGAVLSENFLDGYITPFEENDDNDGQADYAFWLARAVYYAHVTK
jgi:hypothetical protein